MKKINLNNITLTVSAPTPAQFPKDIKPQIAFSGRSNVGKSSLLNSLCARKSLARVSGEPGKTIMANFFLIDSSFYFVDLPGYGYAKRSGSDIKSWGNLVESYLTENKDLKLIIQLVDLKVGPTNDDRMMFEWLVHNRIPFIVVATKADKLNKTDRQKQIEKLYSEPLIPHGIPIIPYSAKTKEGCGDIWSHINTAVGI